MSIAKRKYKIICVRTQEIFYKYVFHTNEFESGSNTPITYNLDKIFFRSTKTHTHTYILHEKLK